MNIGQLLSSASRVPEAALHGQWRTYSHVQRLSWVKGRLTKIVEDLSYCLTGLCEVGIDVRYGEGPQEARRRLEDEIRRRYGTTALELPSESSQSSVLRSHTDNANPNVNEINFVMSQSKTATTIAKQKLREELMARLKFNTMEIRRSVIRKPQATTCEWILTDAVYQSWSYDHAMVRNSGLFWIKGKPGVGKSVLVKFIHQHFLEHATERDIILSFYFNARGETLEKSFLGLYRSLIFQLLDSEEELRYLLDSFNDVKSFDATQVPRLQELLSKAISLVKDKKIYCFIDALDECVEEDVHSMLDLFRDMHEDAAGKQRGLLTCFASRHYPILDMPTAVQLVLEDAGGHAADLVTYVREKLSRGSAAQVRDLQDAVLAKANGIFLWAAVVVEILSAMMRKGRVHELQRRLAEIPRGLAELFRAILTRDNEDVAETLLALRWVLFCYRPLELQEFYFAMMSTVDPQASQELDLDNVTSDQMLSYLINTSKGLAELTVGRRVQLIHESVRDFLLTQGGLQLVGQASTDPVADGHEALKRGCFNVLQGPGHCQIEIFPAATLWERAHGFSTGATAAHSSVPLDSSSQILLSEHDIGSDSDESLPSDPDKPSSKFLFSERLPDAGELSVRAAVHECYPFFGYATNFILFHADSAAAKISQSEFLQAFQVEDWRRKYNVIQRNNSETFPETMSLEAIGAKLKLIKLFPTLSGSGADVRLAHARFTLLRDERIRERLTDASDRLRRPGLADNAAMR